MWAATQNVKIIHFKKAIIDGFREREKRERERHCTARFQYFNYEDLRYIMSELTRMFISFLLLYSLFLYHIIIGPYNGMYGMANYAH